MGNGAQRERPPAGGGQPSVRDDFEARGATAVESISGAGPHEHGPDLVNRTGLIGRAGAPDTRPRPASGQRPSRPVVGSLGQVADRVCEAFDFRDGRGRWQRASCRRALSDLQAAGEVSLPAGQGARGGGGRARVFPHPLAPAVDVPGTVGAVAGLTLALVETDEQRRVWNTLMAHEHPRGAGPFVGPQLRYLVGSAHGWLGGVGFAA